MEEEMMLPMDQQVEEEGEITTQVLILVNRLILISKIQEVLADIGQPDCRLINPYIISDSQELSPWMCDYTSTIEIMISSDKILSLLEPKENILEKYLGFTK